MVQSTPANSGNSTRRSGSLRAVRIASWIVLAGLVAFYIWFAFREDGRLKTVPGVPHAVWYYFDHHATIRNGVGFLILGFVAAAAVAGLSRQWQMLSAGLCVIAPLVKDLAQDFLAPTRHFNWDATGVGTAGAVVGWLAAWFVFSRLVGQKEKRGRACGVQMKAMQ
jgi:hypothetical protein